MAFKNCLRGFGFSSVPNEEPATGDWFSLKNRFSTTNRFTKYLWHVFLVIAGVSSSAFTAYMSSEPKKYLIYLTNWGLTLAFVTVTLQFVISTVRLHTRTTRETDRELWTSEKILLFCQNSLTSLSVLITIFYWTLLYPSLSEENKNKSLLDKIVGHGLWTVLLLIDNIVFCSRKWRWQHFFHPLLFGFCWIAFSLIYFVAGGRSYLSHSTKENAGKGNPYIYAPVNWEKPVETIKYSLFIALLLICIYLSFCVLDWSLRKVSKHFCKSYELHDSNDNLELQTLRGNGV